MSTDIILTFAVLGITILLFVEEWLHGRCSPGMDEHELHSHRCEHHFREIGKLFARV